MNSKPKPTSLKNSPPPSPKKNNMIFKGHIPREKDTMSEWIETQVQDSVVQSVINKFKQRSEVGIKKYNTTLDREDLTKQDWINHAQEEAMDLILYLEKIKRLYI
jgi:hypothetical protein